jgi:hypothetical protein
MEGGYEKVQTHQTARLFCDADHMRRPALG